ncbi:MAG: hypothetical protein DRH24_02440 [Deltaproteobacteria bacterium]|nr:MAG: hypothetical protein DRH24_02440 [Deltaproteobacteria bacterium]
MDIKSKKVLVTGGAGFIGSHLVGALTAKGCSVAVIDNLSSGSLSNLDSARENISFYNGDIRDRDLLMEASDGCDIIFHQAAVVSVPQTVENPVESAMVNEIGTLFVLEAARRNSVKRVVLASSCAVYGDDPHLPKQEKMNSRPVSPYAVQKLSGEYYARLYSDLYGIDTICLRYFNVYGPRQDPSSDYSGVISIFMTKAANNKRPVIYGGGSQFRDFIFVQDVVRANILAASAHEVRGKTFNIGSGMSITINRLWEMVSRIAGIDRKPEYRPSRQGDIFGSVADIDQAKSFLGFKPECLFEKGIEITFQWYKRFQGQ